MAWTNKQKSLLIQACRQAVLDEARRKDVLLRQLPGAMHGGRITSTSSRLNQSDF